MSKSVRKKTMITMYLQKPIEIEITKN